MSTYSGKVIYWLDKKRTIIEVGGEWDRFAQENDVCNVFDPGNTWEYKTISPDRPPGLILCYLWIEDPLNYYHFWHNTVRSQDLDHVF